VTETAKRNLLVGLLGAAIALLLTSPASAKSCGQKVLDDWYSHGTVVGTYEVPCYREALKLLPDDVETYSSAPEEIKRALAIAVKKQRTPSTPVAASTPPPPPPASTSGSGEDGGGSGGSGSSGGIGSGGSGSGSASSGTGSSGKADHTSSSDSSDTSTEASIVPVSPGGGDGGGSGGSAGGGGGGGSVLEDLGPDSADALPLPVLIVAGLALLLVGAAAPAAALIGSVRLPL
jgi:hypothetical protein